MSRSHGVRLLCTVCLGCALFAAMPTAQHGPVEWKVPVVLTAVDKKDILTIARRVGILDPQTVSVPLGSPCLLVQVESKPVVVGNRVLSDLVAIRQKTGPQCGPVDPVRRVQQKGNWVAALFTGNPTLFTGNPRRRELWRIHDGDWHVDIHLGEDVPYDDAVMVVHAIRQKQLVDRRPPPEPSLPIRYIDPSRIRGIGRSDALTILRQYEVTESRSAWGEYRRGGGQLLTVRIRDGRVELHAHLQWIS
jgi:hypothetical protein